MSQMADGMARYELRTLRQMAGTHVVWGAWSSMQCAVSLLTDALCMCIRALSQHTTTDLAAIVFPNRINRAYRRGSSFNRDPDFCYPAIRSSISRLCLAQVLPCR